MIDRESRHWQRAIDETALLIIGEEPCPDCNDYHELRPAGAASCRRARIVRETAIETSRLIDASRALVAAIDEERPRRRRRKVTK